MQSNKKDILSADVFREYGQCIKEVVRVPQLQDGQSIDTFCEAESRRWP